LELFFVFFFFEVFLISPFLLLCIQFLEGYVSCVSKIHFASDHFPPSLYQFEPRPTQRLDFLFLVLLTCSVAHRMNGSVTLKYADQILSHPSLKLPSPSACILNKIPNLLMASGTWPLSTSVFISSVLAHCNSVTLTTLIAKAGQA
jgi:hypothetical protein